MKIPPIVYACAATFGITAVLLLRMQNASFESDHVQSRKSPGAAQPSAGLQGTAQDGSLSAHVTTTLPALHSLDQLAIASAVLGQEQPATEPAATQDESGAELPVRVIFHHLGESRAEAIVVSNSEETLDVLLTVKNEAGKFAQMPFSVEPGAFKKFGSQGELPIESGDRLILQSHNFQDLSDTAP